MKAAKNNDELGWWQEAVKNPEYEPIFIFLNKDFKKISDKDVGQVFNTFSALREKAPNPLYAKKDYYGLLEFLIYFKYAELIIWHLMVEAGAGVAEECNSTLFARYALRAINYLKNNKDPLEKTDTERGDDVFCFTTQNNEPQNAIHVPGNNFVVTRIQEFVIKIAQQKLLLMKKTRRSTRAQNKLLGERSSIKAKILLFDIKKVESNVEPLFFENTGINFDLLEQRVDELKKGVRVKGIAKLWRLYREYSLFSHSNCDFGVENLAKSMEKIKFFKLGDMFKREIDGNSLSLQDDLEKEKIADNRENIQDPEFQEEEQENKRNGKNKLFLKDDKDFFKEIKEAFNHEKFSKTNSTGIKKIKKLINDFEVINANAKQYTTLFENIKTIANERLNPTGRLSKFKLWYRRSDKLGIGDGRHANIECLYRKLSNMDMSNIFERKQLIRMLTKTHKKKNNSQIAYR